MLKDTKVNVLGTMYTVRFRGELSEPRLASANGSCNMNIRDIVVDNLSDHSAKRGSDPAEGYEAWCKRVTRHEIVHAFLYESGICDHDEKMVDWISVMLPKLYEACVKVGCD